MAGVSESIVREYFELHEFLVRQYRKYVAPAVREDDDVDFLVLNPKPTPHTGDLPFILQSADLPRVEQLLNCTPEQRVCAGCGKETVVIGYEESEQLEKLRHQLQARIDALPK